MRRITRTQRITLRRLTSIFRRIALLRYSQSLFEGPALARPRFRFSETKSLHHRDAQSVTGLSENNAKNEAFITFTLLLAWFSVSSTLSSDIFAFV
jgi:hypothetical protein